MGNDVRDPIQGLWIGERLSTVEVLSIRSFLANGHPYHLYTYGPVANVPAGATVLDGDLVLPRSHLFQIQEGWGKGSWAAFSNNFRNALWHRKGGWWCDLDVICLNPFPSGRENVISTSLEAEYGELANNCVAKISAGSDLSAALFEQSHGRVGTSTVEHGPLLLQRMVRELKLESWLVGHEVFCPIGWRAVTSHLAYKRPRTVFERALRVGRDHWRARLGPYRNLERVRATSVAVHLWNEVWGKAGLAKEDHYAPDCLFERLKSRYL